MKPNVEKAGQVRQLANTAQDMLERARQLTRQADDPTIDADLRAKLRAEAEEWLNKAQEIAQTANTLAR